MKKILKKFKRIYRTQKIIRYFLFFIFLNNSKKLVDIHFKFMAIQGFQNQELFERSIGYFNNKPINIFETGSSAKWGTNSSILFDSYIKKFGGSFITVDLRGEANNYLKKRFSKNSLSFVDDSINFIRSFENDFFKKVDLVYLDSYDLDINNPDPSMNHCLEEFLLLDKKIKINSLVVIDDTPNEEAFNRYMKQHLRNNIDNLDFIPGKGSTVLQNSVMEKYEILYQFYGVILKKVK